VLPRLVADMDIAAPVVYFLREQGVDILSAREEGWGSLTDSEILAQAHAMERFVLTHDSDFGTLAVHRGESITGILYLRPGGRPPAEVIADVQALLDAEIDWTPPVIAVYRTGRLRLRKLLFMQRLTLLLFLPSEDSRSTRAPSGAWSENN
jgi:predicted nuclease of predicted toxin-antitoxin system